MEITNNTHLDIELEPLKTAIEEKAHLFLSDITAESLKAFAEAVKVIAEGVMEQYIFRVYDIYSDGALKIADLNILAAFTDYSSGYQSKMLEWNKNHPILLKEQKIEIPKRPIAPNKNIHQPTLIIGIGTVVAIGLYIFSNSWVALAAEILSLALAYSERKKLHAQQDFYEAQLMTYNNQLGMKRMALINGVSDDLVKWLEQGKKYSDSILASYNL